MPLFGTLDKFIGGALALIALYLFVANPNAVNQILNSLAQLSTGVFGTLQGRPVQIGAAGSGINVR